MTPMTNPLSPTRVAAVLALTLLAATADAEIPKVILSAQHQAMCQVDIGDALPALTLTGDQGQVELKSLLGKKATVVAVVGYQHWMNPALLQDLPGDVLKPYEKKGVEVVVVKTGNSPAKLPKGSPLAMLGDPTGEQFAKLGSGRQPRVYVLDAAGKILWFDIEYSRSTRRDLKQTLASVAGE